MRRERQLLATVNRLAHALRERHRAWQEALSDLHPERGPELLRSQAFEIAVAECEVCLTSGFLALPNEPISLEEVMQPLVTDFSAA